jgi:hypothetical protein
MYPYREKQRLAGYLSGGLRMENHYSPRQWKSLHLLSKIAALPLANLTVSDLVRFMELHEKADSPDGSPSHKLIDWLAEDLKVHEDA